jgi:hypothetical protein
VVVLLLDLVAVVKPHRLAEGQQGQMAEVLVVDLKQLVLDTFYYSRLYYRSGTN